MAQHHIEIRFHYRSRPIVVVMELDKTRRSQKNPEDVLTYIKGEVEKALTLCRLQLTAPPRADHQRK